METRSGRISHAYGAFWTQKNPVRKVMREKKALKSVDLSFLVAESAPFRDSQEGKRWPENRPFTLRKRRTDLTPAQSNYNDAVVAIEQTRNDPLRPSTRSDAI